MTSEITVGAKSISYGALIPAKKTYDTGASIYLSRELERELSPPVVGRRSQVAATATTLPLQISRSSEELISSYRDRDPLCSFSRWQGVVDQHSSMAG